MTIIMPFVVYVFLNCADVPSLETWRAAIRRAGFKVELGCFDPLTDSGFIPCRIGPSESGMDYLLHSRDEASSLLADLKIERFDSVVSLSFGIDPAECAIAMVAAAVLTSLSSGLMYEPQDAVRFSGSKALAYARRTMALLPS